MQRDEAGYSECVCTVMRLVIVNVCSCNIDNVHTVRRFQIIYKKKT